MKIRRMCEVAAIFLPLAMVCGCVAPGAPIGVDGAPNYDTMATLQNTAAVLKDAANAFAAGAAGGGVDPFSAGGGVLGGIVLAALAAWRKIAALKKAQDVAIDDAIRGLKDAKKEGNTETA